MLDYNYMKIQMVDLVGQYNKIEQEINTNILDVIKSGAYINGPEVNFFQAKPSEVFKSKLCNTMC